MAYGKQTGSFKGRHITAKYTSKEGATFLDVPYFKLSEKQGDKYPFLTKEQLVELTGKDVFPTEISGDLFEITVREGEYDGAPVRSFKVGLQDGDVRNYVEFGLGSIVGRGVANAVLNLQGRDNVQFGSYSVFNKAKGKSFAQVSVRQGESTDTVKWKYDPKAANSPFPQVRQFEGKGGKTEYDYTAQEVFLFEKLKEFGANIENLPLKAAAPAKAPAPAKAAQPGTQENLDEDVPF